MNFFETVIQALRTKHYAYRTEKTYMHWIRQYVKFIKPTHPREAGADGVKRKHYPKDIKVHLVTPAVRANAIEQCYKNHKSRKGHPWDTSGAYYTPKRFVEWVCPTPLEVATGTGNFLKQAAEGLNKDEFQNPPYNTA